MISIIKSPLILFFAFIVNILIFILIQQMVTNELGELPKFERLNFVDFIRIEQEQKTIEKKIEESRPEQPPPPEDTPPPPELPQPDIKKPVQPRAELARPDINLPLSIKGIPYLGDFLKTPAPAPTPKSIPAKPQVATGLVPTIKIPPAYPPRALRSGIEGVVTVEFTIAIDGSVKNPEIIKANPPDIFNRSVLQTIKKWKFEPQLVDGIAVEKRARQDINFRLQQ